MRRNIIWTVTLEDVVGVKVGVDKRHNPQPLVKRGSKKKLRKMLGR